MPDMFRLENIQCTHPGRANSILCGASLHIAAGERLGLLGTNGSGKSTLLHIGAGLIVPQSGTVTHQGSICRTEEDFARARVKLGYLLQQSQDQLFCSTVIEDVAFGPYNQGKTTRESEEMARATLASLGLEHLAEYNGSRLSGGEQKLAALATILVMQPSLLFLDEPTNDLDPAARERLLAVLERANLPAVIISHDWDFLSRLCTRFCRLENGSISAALLAPHKHTHIHPAGEIEHVHEPCL